MSNWNISARANKFIRENHTNDDIISVCEVISHDGCDMDGYKSDLYDLFIVVKDAVMTDIYNYYYYHRENWFNGEKEDKMYFLEQKIKSCDLIKINNLDDWYKL